MAKNSRQKMAPKKTLNYFPDKHRFLQINAVKNCNLKDENLAILSQKKKQK